MYSKIYDRMIDRPFLVFGILMLITVPLGMALGFANIGTSLLSSFVADRVFFEKYQARAHAFSGDADSVMYVATDEGDKLFTKETLNKIRLAAEEIRKLRGVKSVVSIVDLPRPSASKRSSKDIVGRAAMRAKLKGGSLPDDVPSPVAYWPKDEAKQQSVDLAEVKSHMQSDPLINRTLLSADGHGHAMMIEFDSFDKMTPLDQSLVVRSIEKVPKNVGLGAQGIYLSGLPVIQSRTFEYIMQALVWLLTIGMALISAMVYWIFRHLFIVLLTMTIAGIAIIWAMGVSIICFGTITVLMAAVPLMVLVISTSETIHLVSAYMEELRNGYPHKEAIRKVSMEVGGACILTSFTTFVGFLSLLLIPSATTQHFAVGISVGIAAALLLSLTLVPLALHNWGMKLGLNRSTEHHSNLETHFVTGVGGFCLKHYRLATVLGVSVIGFSMLYSRDLSLDFDLTTRFSKEDQVRKSVEYFNRQFSGTSVVEVFVSAPQGELLAPENLRKLAAFQAKCTDLEVVEQAFSVCSLFEVGNREIGFGTEDGLPETTVMAKTFLQFLGTQNPGVVSGWVDADQKTARVVLRCNFTSFLDAKAVGEQIRGVAETTLRDGVAYDVSGSSILIGDTVRQIINGQFNGFFLCFGTVVVLMAMGLRSIKMGIIALPSSVLPVAALLACVRFSGSVTDSDILGVATVSLGLADSDTIHFLHRYQLERPGSESKQAAILKALRYTGSATVRSAMVLVIGFIPFALSDYFSLRIMGTYLVFVLLVGVLAELSLTPPMVMLLEPEGTSTTGGHSKEGHPVESTPPESA